MAADLLAELGDPRGIPVLRAYISDLGRSPREEDLLTGHHLAAARTAFVQLEQRQDPIRP
jgi:hypothetical protein